MALLPDGMSDADSRTTLSGREPTREERDAASRLEDARLTSRPDGRWRLLAPIRETLLADFPPEAKDRARLIQLFLKRAALGESAGTNKWGEVSEVLIAEAGNLDAMIGVAVKERALPEGVWSAVWGLARFHRIMGLASTASLPAAAERFHDAGSVLGEANIIQSLGDIALARSDHKGARERYEEALHLYWGLGEKNGRANCIRSLGDIALARSDREGALRRYEEALQLYENDRDKAGCIERFGDIALARSDLGGALRHYEEALELFKRASYPLGEAGCMSRAGDVAFRGSKLKAAHENYLKASDLYKEIGEWRGEAGCIQRLGDIALRCCELEQACSRDDEALRLSLLARSDYERALLLYERISDAMGKAGCDKRLGDVALRRFEYDEAHTRYEKAQKLFQQISAVAGEAACIERFGDIALARSDHDFAGDRYNAALELFTRAGDVLGEANCNRGLGDVEEARGEIDGARTFWRKALTLYSGFQDAYSIGVAHNRLAGRAATSEETAAHRAQAQRAWGLIDWRDMIRKFFADGG
jgi:tetratricopeptide (TPR) repeat protein